MMKRLLKASSLAAILALTYAVPPISGAIASAPVTTHDIPALSAKVTHKPQGHGATADDATQARPEVVRIPMLEGVTLTSEQKDAVKGIVSDLRSHLAGLGEKQDKLRKDIAATVNSTGEIDIDRLQSLMKQEGEVRSIVEVAQAKAMAQIHNLLSPAQIAQGVKTRQEIAKLTAQIRALESGQQTPGSDASPSDASATSPATTSAAPLKR